MNAKRRVSFYLSEGTCERLRALAWETRVSLSELAECALVESIDRFKADCGALLAERKRAGLPAGRRPKLPKNAEAK